MPGRRRTRSRRSPRPNTLQRWVHCTCKLFCRNQIFCSFEDEFQAPVPAKHFAAVGAALSQLLRSELKDFFYYFGDEPLPPSLELFQLLPCPGSLQRWVLCFHNCCVRSGMHLIFGDGPDAAARERFPSILLLVLAAVMDLGVVVALHVHSSCGRGLRHASLVSCTNRIFVLSGPCGRWCPKEWGAPYHHKQQHEPVP